MYRVKIEHTNIMSKYVNMFSTKTSLKKHYRQKALTVYGRGDF